MSSELQEEMSQSLHHSLRKEGVVEMYRPKHSQFFPRCNLSITQAIPGQNSEVGTNVGRETKGTFDTCTWILNQRFCGPLISQGIYTQG